MIQRTTPPFQRSSQKVSSQFESPRGQRHFPLAFAKVPQRAEAFSQPALHSTENVELIWARKLLGLILPILAHVAKSFATTTHLFLAKSFRLDLTLF